MQKTLGLFAVFLCLLTSACGGRKEAKPPAADLRSLPVAPEDDGAGFSGRNAYAHCSRICRMGPRPSGSAAYRAQVNYIAEYLQACGWKTTTDTFTVPPGHTMQNLRAVFGDSAPQRPILISCHIDTKKLPDGSEIPGADDGASGAAVLLELARVLAKTPEQARRTELIFFDGEESFGPHITKDDGLAGSRYDVTRRGGTLPACQINLDMVGGAGKTTAVPLLDTPAILARIYLDTVQKLQFSPDRWTFSPGSVIDDHRPFAEAGTDTLNLIAAFADTAWWHKQRDNMQRITADSLGETGQLVCAMLPQLIAHYAAP